MTTASDPEVLDNGIWDHESQFCENKVMNGLKNLSYSFKKNS